MFAVIANAPSPIVAFVVSLINRMGWFMLWLACRRLRVFLLLFLHGITFTCLVSFSSVAFVYVVVAYHAEIFLG